MTRYPELGAAFSAIHENLAESDTRRDHLTECRLAHLEEWAEAAIRTAGEDRDMLLQLLDTLRLESPAQFTADVPKENRESLKQYIQTTAFFDRLTVLRTLTERLGTTFLGDGGQDAPEMAEISVTAMGKIAYVQNSYSNNAYLQFSKAVPTPRAAYFDSFSDVCEEVYNGICEYGILPILHEREGKLFRFYDLLEKYDLRIVSACEVPTTERDHITFTRYALIARTLPPPQETYSHMEILLPAEGGGNDALCDLLRAAQACALTPERLDTRTTEGYDGSLSMMHRITLTVGSSDIRPFLAFLSLDIPRATVLGLYRVLR